MNRLTLCIVILLLLNCTVYSQTRTTEFFFSFDNKKYAGLLDLPSNGKPKSTIILIPGSGRTFFTEGNAYNELRTLITNNQFKIVQKKH